VVKRNINGVETIKNEVSKPPRAKHIGLRVECDNGQKRGLYR
jgi:hypothetical protein